MAAKKKSPAKKKPGGRPKFEVTDEIIELVKTYAGQGFAKKAIAELLGICYDTYNERAKENPEFSAAFREGKLRAVSVAASKLFINVEEGDLPSIKYYLNNQAKTEELGGWSDKQEVAITAPEGITFINNYGPAPE